MTMSRFLAAAAVAALVTAPALAQTTTPPATTTQQRTAPVAPAAPAAPATTQTTRPATAAPAAQTARVNLNTASATELDALPQIGTARAQAIVTERGKGRFRDWADFERRMAGSTVNQQALTAIREKVRF